MQGSGAACGFTLTCAPHLWSSRPRGACDLGQAVALTQGLGICRQRGPRSDRVQMWRVTQEARMARSVQAHTHVQRGAVGKGKSLSGMGWVQTRGQTPLWEELRGAGCSPPSCGLRGGSLCPSVQGTSKYLVLPHQNTGLLLFLKKMLGCGYISGSTFDSNGTHACGQ